MLPALLALAILGVTPPAVDAGYLADDILTRLATSEPGESVSAIVVLEPRISADGLRAEMTDRGVRSRWRRHEFVIRSARSLAAGTQRPLLGELARRRALGDVADYHAFWIVNAVAVTALPDVFRDLAVRSDVAAVYDDAVIVPRAPVDGPVVTAGIAGTSGVASAPGATAIPALDAIRIDHARSRGLTGAGTLVCLFDRGADASHGAFADRWRGARADVPWFHAWNDPLTHTTFPYDEGLGHGTMVLGVMVADAPPGTPLGVAPDAEWIAGGVFGSVTVRDILGLYQWAADPDSNPSTIDDVPDVINNSWGTREDCAPTYWEAIDVVEAAGIVNVIAVDNAGPAFLSVNSPESRAETPFRNFGVGNLDPRDPAFPIHYRSGRGPSPCDGISTKPELTAPGTAITSAFPGDLFAVGTGTSFAAPHVSAAAALLRQIDPDLEVDAIKEILMTTARDLGTPGEDNVYGWGLLDVASAVQVALARLHPLHRPALTGADVIAPGAVRVWWSTPITPTPSTDVTGYRVYRASDEGAFPSEPIASTGAGVRSIEDTGLPDGDYLYAVTAVHPGGESGPGPTARVTVAARTGPGDPGLPDPESGDPGSSGVADAGIETWPNPAVGTVHVRFRMWTDAPASIVIADAGGRIVGRLGIDGRGTTGELIWNGLDELGRALPSGLYFMCLEQNGLRTARRLIRLN